MTAGIGKVTPASDEGQAFAAPGPQDQTQTHNSILPQDDADRKAFYNLRAHAARAGCALYALADGGYLLTHGGAWQRELPDLRVATELLRRMGVSL